MLELILLSLVVGQPPGHAEGRLTPVVPPKRAVHAPSDIGLILGVEDYAQRESARYALTDARRFERLLLDTLGVHPQRVLRLHGERVGEVGVAEAIEALSELAADRPGGRLWLHVGGHGTMIVSDGRPVTLLLGPNAPESPGSTQDLLRNAVNISALLDRLDSLPIRGGLAVIELCRTVEDPQLRPEHWPNPAPRRKIAVWWAAQIGGPAYDLRDARGGGLTHFALRALVDVRDEVGRLTTARARAYAWRGLRRVFAARGAWTRPAPRLVAALETSEVLLDVRARARPDGPR